MLYRLTKSKFILGLQCEKALYLDTFKPQLAYYPPETLARFRRGRDFEAKVKALFPNDIDISQRLGRNIQKYPELTAQMLAQPGVINLYEAGFLYNEVLILADVVHKEADGTLSVYEIKNSSSVKEVFRRDVSLQHYVIRNALSNLNRTPLPHPYRLTSFTLLYNDGDDNPVHEELLSSAQESESLIDSQVKHLQQVLQGLEPNIPVDDHCTTPYACPFQRYCARQISSQLELSIL